MEPNRIKIGVISLKKTLQELTGIDDIILLKFKN